MDYESTHLQLGLNQFCQ